MPAVCRPCGRCRSARPRIEPSRRRTAAGKPNVIGSAVGVLILAVLVRGGPSLGLADSKFKIIKGGLLLLGVTVVIWGRES